MNTYHAQTINNWMTFTAVAMHIFVIIKCNDFRVKFLFRTQML